MYRLRGPLPYQKPALGSRLDLASPLAPGLILYGPANEGGGARLNDLTGRGGTGALSGSGATWAPAPDGPALSFNGSGGMVSGASPFGGLSQATWFSRVYMSSAAGPAACWWCSNQTFSAGFFLGRDSGSSGSVGSGQVYIAGNKTNFPLLFDTWQDVVVTLHGPTVTIYVQGRQVAQSGGQTSVPAHTGYQIGTDATDGLPLTGKVAFWGGHNRALSAADAMALHQSPYGLILPPLYRRYIVHAGGTAYTRSLAWSTSPALAVSRQFAGARSVAPATSPTFAVPRILGTQRAIAPSSATGWALARIYGAARALAPTTVPTFNLSRVFTGARQIAPTTALGWSIARLFQGARGIAPSTGTAFTTTGTKTALRSLTFTTASTFALIRVLGAIRAVAPMSPPTFALARVYATTRTIAPSTAPATAWVRILGALRGIAPATSPAFSVSRSGAFSRAFAPLTGTAVVFTYAGQVAPTPPQGGEYDLMTGGGTLGAAVAPFHGFNLRPDLAVWLAAMRAQSGRWVQ